MTEPIGGPVAAYRHAGGVGGIGAVALADLLGHWPAADGPLYRLLATRIARLADTGELSAGLRLPPERDLASVLSVSRNTVAAAYQVLRDEGMAESRQGAGTPHRPPPHHPSRGAPGQRLSSPACWRTPCSTPTSAWPRWTAHRR